MTFPKTLSILSYITHKSIKPDNLISCKQIVFGLFLEKLQKTDSLRVKNGADQFVFLINQ